MAFIVPELVEASRIIFRSHLCNYDEGMKQDYSEAFISDIIRMAWADDISFDEIKKNRGLSEAEVIKVMRGNLKAGSFKLWRKRVNGRNAKHAKRAQLLQQTIR
jgi:uncharacterized protein (TIGR03643 family)